MADNDVSNVSKVVVTEAGKAKSKEVQARLSRAQAREIVERAEKKAEKRKARRAKRAEALCDSKRILGIECKCKRCR